MGKRCLLDGKRCGCGPRHAVLNLLIGVVDSNAARLGPDMIHRFSDVQHKLFQSIAAAL
jgi:hypothetical protein